MKRIKRLFNSLKYALCGLKSALLEEHAFSIQFVVGFFVIFLMFAYPLSTLERAVLFLVIIMVLALELVNSQIERVLDLMDQDFNSHIKKIKDLSAAAVLLAIIGSIIVGLLIFLPYIV